MYYRKYISSLGFIKLLNILLLFLSYVLSSITKQVIIWGKPASISIEPTTSCNLKCPECPTGLGQLKRPKGNISFELFKKTINETKRSINYLMLYFQGEPFLHSDFLNMVRYAEENNIYTCTSTNGHFLDTENSQRIIDSKLSRIIISMDGADDKSYRKYRIGGDFNKVMNGIKTLADLKTKNKSTTPYIIIQSLILSSNENELNEIKKLENIPGINKVSFKTAQFYNYENGKSLMPDNSKLSRYKKTNGKYKIKQKLKNRCWKMWHSLVITWDGKVLPCCFDKHSENELGDLNTQKLKDIWQSEEYKSFRKKVLRKRKGIEICCNCGE